MTTEEEIKCPDETLHDSSFISPHICSAVQKPNRGHVGKMKKDSVLGTVPACFERRHSRNVRPHRHSDEKTPIWQWKASNITSLL
jgi:hypothetical protein